MRNKQQSQAQIIFKCLQQVEHLSLDGDIQRRDWFIGYDQARAERESARQAHPLTLGARVVLHPDDAAAAGVHEDNVAKLATAAGTGTLPVAVSDKVARGCAWVESGYGATAALAGKVEVRSA